MRARNGIRLALAILAVVAAFAVIIPVGLHFGGRPGIDDRLLGTALAVGLPLVAFVTYASALAVFRIPMNEPASLWDRPRFVEDDPTGAGPRGK